MLKLHLKVHIHERYQRGQTLLDMIFMFEVCNDWDQRENHLIFILIWIEHILCFNKYVKCLIHVRNIAHIDPSLSQELQWTGSTKISSIPLICIFYLWFVLWKIIMGNMDINVMTPQLSMLRSSQDSLVTFTFPQRPNEYTCTTWWAFTLCWEMIIFS